MLNEGGEKTYKSLMNLEKGIKDLEKTFKRDARDMERDRAGKVKKHIDAIKKRGYTDNFERSRRTALRFMPDTARKVMGKLLVGTRDSIDRLLKG